MSTDFENELRDLFREKAEEAPLATPAMPAAAPRQVLRRSRRHQVGTVLGSAVVVVALIVGSVAGLTRILGEGGDDKDIGDGGYEVFQRTATVEAFTVGSPSDWFLVNQWPLSMLIAVEGSGGSSSACIAEPGNVSQECENTPGNAETSSPIPVPHGLPMLQLSNIDLGLAANACADGLPADGAVLYVALDYNAAIAGIADPSIQEFPPGIGLPPEGDGPCGPGRYAYFTVNGERFFSWIGVGSGASDEDRETVETSYEMMSAIPDWTPTPPDETTPAYVIAGGLTQDGDDWRLELRPSEENVRFSLIGIAALSDFVIPPSVIEWAATDPVFGAISKQAAAVEFRGLDDPSIAIPGTIVPLPPSMPFDFDLFFIEGTAGIEGEAVAVGPDGEPIEGGSSVGTVREDVVRLDGTTARTRLDGPFPRRLRGRHRLHRRHDRRNHGHDGPLVPSSTRHVVGGSPTIARWVALRGDVCRRRIGPVRGDRHPVPERRPGTSRRSWGTCAAGPAGWTDHDVCAIALPPEDSGTFEYLDADGVVIFDEAGSWGFAEASPSVPARGRPGARTELLGGVRLGGRSAIVRSQRGDRRSRGRLRDPGVPRRPRLRRRSGRSAPTRHHVGRRRLLRDGGGRERLRRRVPHPQPRIGPGGRARHDVLPGLTRAARAVAG